MEFDGEAAMDKQQWKNEVKENLKRILKQKPEAVYVEGNVFETYPIVHQLRKKHIPVLTMMEKDGQKLIIQIPSRVLSYRKIKSREEQFF